MEEVHIDKIPKSEDDSHDAISNDNDLLIKRSRMEVPALTPEVLAAIQDLDEAEGMSAARAVELLGVFYGVKPTCLFAIEHLGDSLERPRDIGRRLGLCSKTTEDRAFIVFSRYSELADELVELVMRSGRQVGKSIDRAAEYRIGRLLGYPETSTDYYLYRLEQYGQTGEFPPTIHLPEEYGDMRCFQASILSPGNWQNEADILIKPIWEMTKMMTPNLYKRRLATSRRK